MFFDQDRDAMVQALPYTIVWDYNPTLYDPALTTEHATR